jgi:F0F1-type ATP synthase membrane subunit b/b'
MNISTTFFLNAGLFDFDLTFPLETALFILLATIVTFVFLNPISKQLDERAEFIDYTLRKSTILLSFGYEKLSECVGLLTEEISEMNRQIKLVRDYTNSQFENEVSEVQKENMKILSQLKGDLAIKSAYLFSSLSEDLTQLTDKFFAKKFQSA